MKKIYYLLLTLLFPFILTAQDYYFPPLIGNEWETISPTDAGFCSDEIPDLLTFLEEKNSKAFIILKDGKIVVEEYFNGFGQDSVWYWASVAKTLTGFLVGVAQEEGLLNIEDKTSDYLGTGWTNAPLQKEDLITIKNQLSMNTGLDDSVADLNCIDPSCLNYLSDAGDRWAYYNAPYRLLQNVVAQASGQTFQNYTFQKISTKIGMTGLWSNYIFVSKPRSMARFGSLILNQGIWNGNTILSDVDFMDDMVNTSQNLNPSYGYLWWLNGKGSYMLPQSQFTFNTDLIPNAPDEMYAALGKNDQKIYVIPSQKIVVIRMGESSGTSLFALSSFDNQLWERLSNVFCNTTSVASLENKEIKTYPNPVNDVLFFENETAGSQIKIFNTYGQEVKNEMNSLNQIDVSNLQRGIYFLHVSSAAAKTKAVSKFIKS